MGYPFYDDDDILIITIQLSECLIENRSDTRFLIPIPLALFYCFLLGYSYICNSEE